MLRKKKAFVENYIVEDLRKAIPALNYTPVDYVNSEKWLHFTNAGLSEKTNEILNSVKSDEFIADMLDPYIDAMVDNEITHLQKQLAGHLHAITNYFGKVKGSTKEVAENLEYLQKDLKDVEEELNNYINIKNKLEEEQNDKS